MPSTKTVTLSYSAGSKFGPNITPLKIEPGDTISFVLSDATRNDPALQGCRLQITFHHGNDVTQPPRHISPRSRVHGAGQNDRPLNFLVTPNAAANAGAPPSTGVHYKCELLDRNGNAFVPPRVSDTGGEAEPDTGFGGAFGS